MRREGLVPVRLPDGRLFELVRITSDGEPAWLLRCPDCGTVGTIDSDQFCGRVSTQCATEGCSFHQTIDFSAGAIAD